MKIKKHDELLIDGYLPYIGFAMWQNDSDKVNEYLDLQRKEYGPITSMDLKLIMYFHNRAEERYAQLIEIGTK